MDKMVIRGGRRLEGEVAAPLAFLPGRWWGELSYENQDLRTEVDASKGGTTLRGTGEMVGGALRYHLPGPGLTLQASLPLWHRGNLDRRVSGLGVRLEPAPELSLQVAHTRLDELEAMELARAWMSFHVQMARPEREHGQVQ